MRSKHLLLLCILHLPASLFAYTGNWYVNGKPYDIRRELGEGTFSVAHVSHSEEHGEVVVKISRNIISDELREERRRGLELMKELGAASSRIAGVIDFEEDDTG